MENLFQPTLKDHEISIFFPLNSFSLETSSNGFCTSRFHASSSSSSSRERERDRERKKGSSVVEIEPANLFFLPPLRGGTGASESVKRDTHKV